MAWYHQPSSLSEGIISAHAASAMAAKWRGINNKENNNNGISVMAAANGGENGGNNRK
jgi:hypothetical protein